MPYCVTTQFRDIFVIYWRFRPELRQYLIEDDQAAVPFSRQQRALAYQRAKNVSDTNAFGTLENLYQSSKEWFLQSTLSYPSKKPIFVLWWAVNDVYSLLDVGV